MQDYYNYIPTYGVGGLLERIAKSVSRAKIQGHANLLHKSNPELSKLLSKLAKSQKGGVKLTEEESKKLVALAQDYRRNNIHYQNRRKQINEQAAARRQPKQEVASPNIAQTNPTRGSYLDEWSTPPTPRANRIRGTRSKREAQQNPVQNQVQNQVQAPPLEEAPAAQPTNPIPGTTLSARWQAARKWMNEHPKTTIGVPLLALGTGPGRYITGKALKITQSDPASWFGEQPQQSTDAQDFIMINGTKIPIKRSSEGYFIPAENNEGSSQTIEGGDAIDAALAGITNDNLGISTQPQQGNFDIPDQQTINDLFSDDQW